MAQKGIDPFSRRAATEAFTATFESASAAAASGGVTTLAGGANVATEPLDAVEDAPETTDDAPVENEGDAPAPEVEEGTPAGERPAPHLPRFAEVPDDQKWPDGPYKQAPAEYGGEWWQVSPFTGSEPWKQTDPVVNTDPNTGREIPEDFVRIYGERPVRAEGMSSMEHRIAVNKWEQDLQYFGGSGTPEGYSAEQVDAAKAVFESWGMGEPEFFEGRYGWNVRFPDSNIPHFEANPNTALEAPHLVVARYQVRMAQSGAEVTQRHPFVPPQLFREDA